MWGQTPFPIYEYTECKERLRVYCFKINVFRNSRIVKVTLRKKPANSKVRQFYFTADSFKTIKKFKYLQFLKNT